MIHTKGIVQEIVAENRFAETFSLPVISSRYFEILQMIREYPKKEES